MKILILDNDELVLQGLKYIQTFNGKFEYFYINDIRKNTISFDDIDLVIVDFEYEEYFSIYKQILQHDKSKKIIVSSEKLVSCIDENCDFCLDNYKIRRVIKPVEMENLYTLINSSFEEKCRFQESFLNMKSLLSCIVKRFSSLQYNEDKKIIEVTDKTPSNIYTYELISIVNILEQNSVEYSVLDDKKVQIL